PLYFSSSSVALSYFHSFPTRRSSDLSGPVLRFSSSLRSRYAGLYLLPNISASFTVATTSSSATNSSFDISTCSGVSGSSASADLLFSLFTLSPQVETSNKIFFHITLFIILIFLLIHIYHCIQYLNKKKQVIICLLL